MNRHQDRVHGHTTLEGIVGVAIVVGGSGIASECLKLIKDILTGTVAATVGNGGSRTPGSRSGRSHGTALSPLAPSAWPELRARQCEPWLTGFKRTLDRPDAGALIVNTLMIE